MCQFNICTFELIKFLNIVSRVFYNYLIKAIYVFTIVYDSHLMYTHNIYIEDRRQIKWGHTICKAVRMALARELWLNKTRSCGRKLLQIMLLRHIIRFTCICHKILRANTRQPAARATNLTQWERRGCERCCARGDIHQTREREREKREGVFECHQREIKNTPL